MFSCATIMLAIVSHRDDNDRGCGFVLDLRTLACRDPHDVEVSTLCVGGEEGCDCEVDAWEDFGYDLSRVAVGCGFGSFEMAVNVLLYSFHECLPYHAPSCSTASPFPPRLDIDDASRALRYHRSLPSDDALNSC